MLVESSPAIAANPFVSFFAEAKESGTVVLAHMFDGDVLYEGGEETALTLPTFLGNHDFGRFAMFVREMGGSDDPATLLARARLGHAMMFLLRGVPTVYYGDEQGFISDGNDQLARAEVLRFLNFALR